MKKIFIILILLNIINTCTTIPRKCHTKCLKKGLNIYIRIEKFCKVYCKNNEDDIFCMNKCMKEAGEKSFQIYEHCFDDCHTKAKIYRKKYKWLTFKLFKLYYERSIQYKIPMSLALALIQRESNGKNIISRKNKNGTHDYGRMQINSIHMRYNPKLLLNDKINSKKGFWYLSMALKKAKYNKYEAIRMYNQGLYGKKNKYKRWNYVYSIIRDYQNTQKMIYEKS